jgi:hypothetical protein
MFWFCPYLADYWSTIFKTLSEAFDIKLQPSAEMAIFGVPNNNCSLTNRQLDAIAFASLLARRRIFLDWKSINSPLASLWLKDLKLFLKLEIIMYSNRRSTNSFYSTWDPMISSFEQLQTLPPD